MNTQAYQDFQVSSVVAEVNGKRSQFDKTKFPGDADLFLQMLIYQNVNFEIIEGRRENTEKCVFEINGVKFYATFSI